MRMVWRVCQRAGVRRLSPHQLRHGFANRFLRESGRDFVALQALDGPLATGHDAAVHGRRRARRARRRAREARRPGTHKRRQIWRRLKQKSPARWKPLSGGGGNRTRVRRRTGQNVYKRSPRFNFDTAAGGGRPTADLAILRCRALGDWLSLRAEPVIWRRYPSHGPSPERRRYLTRLGSECEFVIRTYCFAGGFTRPTGDLGLQLCRRIDHVEARSPPYVCSANFSCYLRDLSARCMSRSASRFAMSRRLSRPSLPRARASSTLARPFLK